MIGLLLLILCPITTWVAASTCDGFGQCQIESFQQHIDINNTIFDIDRPFFTESRLKINDSRLKQLPSNFFLIWPNLIELVAEGCGLEELPTDSFNLTQLSYLVLSKNELTEVRLNSLAGAVSLTELFLSHNQIENVAFGNLTNLRNLHLAGNRLKVLTNETFCHLPSLRVLHLDDNRLRCVDFAAFWSNSQLELIDLQNNELERMYAPVVQSLRTLILSKNLLTNVDALVNFTSLVAVHLDGNRALDYGTLAFGNSTRTLERLDLSGTSLFAVRDLGFLDKLDDLRELNLAENNMTNLDLSKFPALVSLEQLSVAKNQLSAFIGWDLWQEKFPKLVYLQVFGNPMDCTFIDTLQHSKFIGNGACQKPLALKTPLMVALSCVGVMLSGLLLAGVGYLMTRTVKKETTMDVPPNNLARSSKPYLRYESTVQELTLMVEGDDNPDNLNAP